MIMNNRSVPVKKSFYHLFMPDIFPNFVLFRLWPGVNASCVIMLVREFDYRLA
jgi:hypothetical protein